MEENRAEYRAESAADNRAEYRTESGADNRTEYRTESADNRAENRAEYAADNRAEYRAESGADNRAEYRAESAADNRAEYRAESAADNRAENRAEYGADNRAEYRTESAADNRAENRTESSAGKKEKSAPLGERFRHAPVWKLAAADLLMIAAVLCVFAYFHVLRSDVISEVPAYVAPVEVRNDLIAERVSRTDAEDDGPYSDEVITSENAYTSPFVSVTLSEGEYTGSGGDKAVYHLADIHVRDITSIRTVFARDSYGRGIDEDTLDMARRTGAVCAINGDYYGTSEKNMIIRNGTAYGRRLKGEDICVLYASGEMKVYGYETFDCDAAVKAGAWQAWSFGPSLLDENGQPRNKFKSSVKGDHPRSVIGYYEPGHYCFLAVDGRSRESVGITLDDLAKLCAGLDMKCAYNLDGGRTSVMTFTDRVANVPYLNGRGCSDFIGVYEPEEG